MYLKITQTTAIIILLVSTIYVNSALVYIFRSHSVSFVGATVGFPFHLFQFSSLDCVRMRLVNADQFRLGQ